MTRFAMIMIVIGVAIGVIQALLTSEFEKRSTAQNGCDGVVVESLEGNICLKKSSYD